MFGRRKRNECLACRNRGNIFKTVEELQAHYESDHPDRWFCPRTGCPNNYGLKGDLKIHLQREHYGRDVRDPRLHYELEHYALNRRKYIDHGTPVVRYEEPPALPPSLLQDWQLIAPQNQNMPPPSLQQQHLNTIGSALPVLAGLSTSQRSPLQNIVAPSVPALQLLQDPGFGARFPLAQIIAGLSNSQFGSLSSQSAAELLSPQQFLQNLTSSQPQSDPNDSQERSSTMIPENGLGSGLAGPSTLQPQEQLQNQSAGPSSLIQSESSAFRRYLAPHSSQEQQPSPNDDDQHEGFTPSAPKRRRE